MTPSVSVALVGLNFGEWWLPHYAAHPDVGRVVLCEPNLFASEFRQGQIFHFERLAAGLAGFFKSVRAFDRSGHVLLLYLLVLYRLAVNSGTDV